MTRVLVEETNLSNIANAIREKTNTTNTFKPSEMSEAISGITTNENLSSELNSQNELLNNQETTIDNIIDALADKVSEDLTVELTAQDTLIDTQETSINDIIEALNGKAGSTGGASGDIWIVENELYINVKKYRDISEYFNSNFTFPFNVNVEDGDSFSSLGSITVTEETDIIVIDLTPYIDYEKLWMGSSHGMFNLMLEKIGEEYIVSNMGFTLSSGNG